MQFNSESERSTHIILWKKRLIGFAGRLGLSLEEVFQLAARMGKLSLLDRLIKNNPIDCFSFRMCLLMLRFMSVNTGLDILIPSLRRSSESFRKGDQL